MMFRRPCFALLSALVVAALAACGGSDNDAERSVASLRFIGEQTISNSLQVDGTLVGGLSGIDFDGRSGAWFVVSDDRSDTNPARYYTASLSYDQNRFSSVQINTAVTLRQADGSSYPNRTAGGNVPDPESLRVDPSNNTLWWTSEGDRARNLDPFVAQIDATGKLLTSFALPAMFKMNAAEEKGSRNNATFEGLAFAPDGQSIWVAMEAPIYEDGPLPTPTSPAVSRFTRVDRAGKVLAQYAYPIDAIPVAPAAGKNADNGMSEILAVNEHQLLVIERAGVQGADGNYSNYIRLYEVDTDGASNIAALPSLVGASYTPLKKRLVLDLNTLGLAKLDNIEGITWGPKLANGHNSLVLVSDNNFNPASQITQFLAFEVTPKKEGGGLFGAP
jgi:hypothetical protein